MFSGVSGLRVHQTKMDVIGNNIANVNTVGFKSGRVTFNEVFSQTLQGASGSSAKTGRGGRNPMQIGLGVNVSSIDTLMTEGAAQRTDNPLDLKIEGDEFFIVSDANGSKYTRAGAFKIDHDGNLITSSGMKVMGWKGDATGKVDTNQPITNLTVLDPANSYSKPELTGNVALGGNININHPNADTTGIPFTMTIYDSLGTQYTVNMKAEQQDPDKNKYNITLGDIKDEKGNLFSGTVTLAGVGSPTLEFDTNGAVTPTSLRTGELTITPTTPFSTFAVPLKIDFSNLTQYNEATSIEAMRGPVDPGRRSGEVSGFNIGGDGKIQLRYSNGESKEVGQVAVARFKNAAGLQKVGDNLFDVTPNSGDPFTKVGTFNGGVLEMSNVDLSKEFTELITTQRGFQANSRIITSSDEMLQELVNLKR